MWTFIVLLQSVVLLIILYIKNKYSYWKDRGVPYAEPKFPYGTIQVGEGKPHLALQNLELYKKYKHQTPFVGLFFGLKPAALAVDIEFIKNILTTDFKYFPNRGFYFNEKKEPLTRHLFFIEGARWRSTRAKLTPTFSSGKIKFMYPTMVAVGHEFIRVLGNEVKNSKEVDMKEFLGRFTTDIIGSCAFGLECNSLVDPEAEFRKMGRKIFAQPRVSRKIAFVLTSFKGLAKFLNVGIMRKEISEFFMKNVKETVEYREKNNIYRNDFMDLLIKLKNSDKEDERLTLNEIAAQSLVFFAAGFETSSTAMSYALFELAQNEEVQEKARKNVQEVLNKNEGKFTYDSVSEMSYIDHCISESMRKYPLGFTLTRIAEADYTYKNYKIQKGTQVIVPVYSVHHDEYIYPEPEVYRPERFEPHEVAKRPPCSYIPFGDGPRNCIGSRFGLMQARTGLAMLLHNFRFKLSPKTKLPLTFSQAQGVLTVNGQLLFEVEKLN